jgi:sarcosine oxidase, subunit beta
MSKYDIVVIGGGLVGCATAYYLARSKANVLIIEKGELNRQASGQNAGSLHFQLEHRLVKFWDTLKGTISEMIPISIMAQDLWSTLEQELQADMEVVQHGGLMLAETEEDVDKLKRKHRLEKELGLDSQLLTGEDARSIAPYLGANVLAAAYCPAEGHANPRVVTLEYAKKARESGVEIRSNTLVMSLNRTGGEWKIRLQTGEMVRADNIVIATGAWAAETAQLAGLHLPMYPVPLMMNVTEPVEQVVGHLIQHVGKKLTFKQVRDGNILIGGGWPSRFTTKHGLIDLSKAPIIDPSIARTNLKVACSVVPSIQRLRLLRTWPGVAGVSGDQLPVLGEFPERPGMYVAGGGSAFTLGPAYARLITELILTNRTSLPIASFSPSRFSHLNLFMQ